MKFCYMISVFALLGGNSALAVDTYLQGGGKTCSIDMGFIASRNGGIELCRAACGEYYGCKTIKYTLFNNDNTFS